MSRWSLITILCVLLLVSVVVSSCGGDGSSAGPTPPANPDATPHGEVEPPVPSPTEPVNDEGTAETETPVAPTPPPEPEPPVEVGPDSGLPPNEMGSVVVLMYHHLGDEDSTWVRSRDRFREDLSYLYQHGYRPVSVESYLSGTMDLPAGMTPVILTFDDGLSNQLRWVDGEVGQPDPDCAVGIMMNFADEHPGFEPRAIFYINSPRPFYPLPEEDIAASLQWLVEQGFELGNHTHFHPNLRELHDQEVQRVIAKTHAMVGEWVPGYQIDSLALPFGVWPRNRTLAYQGEHEGLAYDYGGVMLVGAEPALSPFSQSFAPRAIPRVRASDDQWELWFTQLETHPGRRYVSDGDPNTLSVPEASQDRVDRDRVADDVEVVVIPSEER